MNHLNESMKYERAFSEVSNLRCYLVSQRNKAEDKARQNGEKLPDHFDIIIDALFKLQDEFRAKSDAEWNVHKNSNLTPHPDGVRALSDAVVMSAIEDYEKAISSGRPGANGVRASIKRFAMNEAGFYTTADVMAILTRIDAKYKVFKKIVEYNLKEIAEDTKKHRDYCDCKFRCPLCGGGLYLSKGEEKRVKCSSCNLSALVYIN